MKTDQSRAMPSRSANNCDMAAVSAKGGCLIEGVQEGQRVGAHHR